MPVLYRASLGYLVKHPWQLALALLGIAIGVAVIVAVDLANASSRKAFLLSMDTLNGKATHQIVAGPSGVGEALYVRLRTQHGIRDIAPVVQGDVEAAGRSLSVLGVDVFAERGFRTFTLPGKSEGVVVGDQRREASTDVDTMRALLTRPGTVLLTQATAGALGVESDGRFQVETGGRRFPAVVVGTLTDDDGRLNDLLIVDIATAQIWFEQVGFLSRIDVRLPDAAAAATLEALLPAGVELLSAEGRTQATTDMTSAFMTNLTAMSLLALLVGVFLIYNSVGFAVLQRRGLIGVLRALGLTRQQAFVLIMSEGVVLGIVGSLIGVAAGIWLGDKLLVLVSQSINDLYFRVTVTDVSVGPAALAKGIAAGLGATAVAAAIPAHEAAAYPPTLSLTRSVLERRAGRLVPLLLIAGLAGVAGAALLLAYSGKSLVAGLAALFVLILGCALCIPLVVRSVTALSSGLAGRLGGTSARLAVDGIRASLSRTGVAIVALAVAVSATVGVSVMVGSFRDSVSDWLATSLQSDIYVGVPSGSLSPDLIADLVALDGIAEYSSRRRVWLESESGRTRVVALEMARGSYAGTEFVDASPEAAWRAFDDEEAVIVSEPYAYRNDVGAGDRIALTTNAGPRTFAIAATYRSYDADQGAVIMSRATYDRYWSDDRVDSIGMYLDAGADEEAVMARIREVSAGRQAIRVSSNRALRELSLAIFDRTFIITDVLYWLAVGVAVIGILGAMLALQLERARELAVLRALGMTPGQLGAMVTLQTGIIGLLSGLAALPLGLLMAWLLIHVINRRSFGWQMELGIDPVVLVSALALSVGAALAAGLYPAYRAARSRPAAAMREE